MPKTEFLGENWFSRKENRFKKVKGRISRIIIKNKEFPEAKGRIKPKPSLKKGSHG